MVLRDTIVNTNAHAHRRWPASCKRGTMLTKYLHGTATRLNIRSAKYSSGPMGANLDILGVGGRAIGLLSRNYMGTILRYSMVLPALF